MKRKKKKKITDELIGQADKVCACSAIVGDIIAAQNEDQPEKTSLKKIKDELERKAAGEDDALEDDPQGPSSP